MAVFGFYRAYTFSDSGPQILGLDNLRERERVLVRLEDVGTMLRMDLLIVVIVSFVPQRVFKYLTTILYVPIKKMGINICSHAL